MTMLRLMAGARHSKQHRRAVQNKGMSEANTSTFAQRCRPLSLVAAILWGFVIVAASFLPGYSKQSLHMQGTFHVFCHFVAYFILTPLLLLSFRATLLRGVALSSSILIAVATEIGEHLVFRTAIEYRDMAIDLCGIVCGVIVVIVYSKLTSSRGSDDAG